jgi:hypothetical protein
MPWRHMGEWRYSSTIRDLGTRWWVVSFMPLQLNLRERAPGYALDRRPGGPRSRSGRGGEQKIFALRWIEPGPSLYRLSYPDSFHPVCIVKFLKVHYYDFRCKVVSCRRTANLEDQGPLFVWPFPSTSLSWVIQLRAYETQLNKLRLNIYVHKLYHCSG